ncbi:MAG: hypothetical protein GXO85_13535, partial [Chlorobi bacterium]|nr:hypothetical protein [Chlorobiota bacterium]
MRKIIIFIFAATVNILAQNISQNLEQSAADSILSVVADSSEIIDTLKKHTQSDLVDIVYANASDSLMFDVKDKKMYLYGDGDIKYQ